MYYFVAGIKMGDILNVQSPVTFDESISNYELHAHQPYASSNFNHSDEIRIAIQYQDLAVLPSRSYLHITGQKLKTDSTVATGSPFVTNAICHLIDDIRYELNAIEIDHIKNVGIASTLKGYVSLNRSDCIENSGWISNSDFTIDVDGGFDVCIPVSYTHLTLPTIYSV